jgi:hypothetical protein
MRPPYVVLLLGLSISILPACGDPQEATRVELDLKVDATGIATVTNDLGYTVTLTDARMMMENVSFTIAGEADTASLWNQVSDFLVFSAYAHPGHFQGGETTGELRGRFQVNWLGAPNVELGTATLLAGRYTSANFNFIQASRDDGFDSDDPFMGHTAWLAGTAVSGPDSVNFTIIIDAPEGRQLVGAPFEFTVNESTQAALGLRLLTEDPLEGDTLFDGIDFAALDEDGDGQLTISPDATQSSIADAYNLLRRTFQTHDHFDIRASQPE